MSNVIRACAPLIICAPLIAIAAMLLAAMLRSGSARMAISASAERDTTASR